MLVYRTEDASVAGIGSANSSDLPLIVTAECAYVAVRPQSGAGLVPHSNILNAIILVMFIIGLVEELLVVSLLGIVGICWI